MGRNLSPILRRELANLDKDAESRRTAMKTLKSYVKELDSKAIPLFLAQVSETNETCSLSGECTISLYEVLARVHGVKIVPLIDNIMATIIKTLASSAGSFPLQQACSKVVPAIARYGIDPTTPEEKKRHVIHSVCIPLCDSLLGSQESLTSGAALCLKALVDSDNWRFASHEMVNKVCQNVAGALEEKSTQTNSHMGLVMTLAKRNARMVEPYARILVHSGRQILNLEIFEGGSQKRLSAIQMINFLMKCLDSWCILSEIHLIIEDMEKCQFDQMPYVRGAAFEAMQTAKKLASEKGSKFDKSPGSVTGSNFSTRRNISNGFGDVTPTSASPESQTLDYFIEYESMVGSPASTRGAPRNSDYDRRSVNRKLWRYENCGVDVSLKDGLFSELAQGNSISDTYSIQSKKHRMFNDNGGDCSNEFAGFFQNSPGLRLSRSTTNSPMRSRSNINAENIIFKTPRKLVHSLQDLNDTNSALSENNNNNNSRGRRLRRSLSSGHFDWALPAAVSLYSDDDHHNNYRHDGFYEDDVMNNNDQDEGTGENENANLYVKGGSESVASTNDIVPGDVGMQLFSQESKSGEKTLQWSGLEKKKKKKTSLKLVCGFSFVLVAIFTPLLWIIEQENQGHFLVPT